MEIKKLTPITLIVFFVSVTSVLADEVFEKHGVGVLKKNRKESLSKVKYFSLGLEKKLTGPVDQKAELGLWVDSVGFRESSGFASWSAGFKTEGRGFVASSYWGAAAITHTDSYLSTHYQFVYDVSLGYRGEEGKEVKVNGKHFSNAGLKEPNFGRNFINLEVTIPWN